MDLMYAIFFGFLKTFFKFVYVNGVHSALPSNFSTLILSRDIVFQIFFIKDPSSPLEDLFCVPQTLDAIGLHTFLLLG